MNRAPAFQFYPADFLADERVVLMTLEERGTYITLLCFCWREGSIPADVSQLGRLCGVDGNAMAVLWQAIRPCFQEARGEPARLIHARLEKEREKQASHRTKKSEAGKKGANSRWDKARTSDGGAMPVPQQPDGTCHGSTEALPSSASSSSSSLWDPSTAPGSAKDPPAHQELAERYRRQWTETYPDGKCVLVQRHFVISSQVLKSLQQDVPLAYAALDRFMADRSDFVVSAKHPIELFSRNLSTYTTSGKPRAPATTEPQPVVPKKILN